jgi:hypothetical protein
MPVGEIAVGLTSLRAALDIAKTMIGLRDAEAFRGKSIELQGLILEALEKAIESREAYSAQIDHIRTLEAEMANLKAWGAEKARYQLKNIGTGAVAYMLKPDARGSEPPHWLCPNCYANGKKGFLQPSPVQVGHGFSFKCTSCGVGIACDNRPHWLD